MLRSAHLAQKGTKFWILLLSACLCDAREATSRLQAISGIVKGQHCYSDCRIGSKMATGTCAREFFENALCAICKWYFLFSNCSASVCKVTKVNLSKDRYTVHMAWALRHQA
eukprot:5326785-Amphidinium_carterae.1